jgi:hypothetical protein
MYRHNTETVKLYIQKNSVKLAFFGYRLTHSLDDFGVPHVKKPRNLQDLIHRQT